MGTGYAWLYADGLSFGGKPCWLSLCFQARLTGRRLESAHLSVDFRTDPVPGQWASQEEMDAEIVFMRAELQRQLGRPFRDEEEKFPWGGVWCSYDPRSDTASSGVRYT